jgi:flagellin-like protein
MKANRKSLNGDDAVSPVIAVILMVAITVVLAATVYLWVSGFGSNQNNLVQASFGAKAVDFPTMGDTDSSDDAIQLTYVSGPEDLQATDISISVDGVLLSVLGTATTAEFFPGGTYDDTWCTSNPGGTADADILWERGASVYLILTNASSDCTDGIEGPATGGANELDNMDGIHQITLSVKGQVVLDTSVEVHDDGSA